MTIPSRINLEKKNTSNRTAQKRDVKMWNQFEEVWTEEIKAMYRESVYRGQETREEEECKTILLDTVGVPIVSSRTCVFRKLSSISKGLVKTAPSSRMPSVTVVHRGWRSFSDRLLRSSISKSNRDFAKDPLQDIVWDQAGNQTVIGRKMLCSILDLYTILNRKYGSVIQRIAMLTLQYFTIYLIPNNVTVYSHIIDNGRRKNKYTYRTTLKYFNIVSREKIITHADC